MKFQLIALNLGIVLLYSLAACNTPKTASEQAAVGQSGSLESVSIGDIRNVHKLDDIWFAGQPAAEDILILNGAGIKSVLNLRHAAEHKDLDEKQIVQSIDMNYVNVPFSGQAQLTDEVFDAVRNELRTAERPLFFHCASANRVGATWLPYRVLDEAVDFEQALREAKEIGLRSPGYLQRAREYIAAQQATNNHFNP